MKPLPETSHEIMMRHPGHFKPIDIMKPWKQKAKASPHEIAKSARSLALAEQCVRAVLRLNNERDEKLLPEIRQAELEAICVILMRAKSEIYKQYPLKST